MYFFRLNIDEKLDIISDSDIDVDDESSTSDKPETVAEKSSDKIHETDESCNGGEIAPSKSVTKSSTTAAKEKSKKQATNKSALASGSKLPKPSFRLLPEYDKETIDAPTRSSTYYRYIEKSSEDVAEEVNYEYVMFFYTLSTLCYFYNYMIVLFW